MPKSFRMDEDLEGKLKQAADVAGVPESVLIREAVTRRCDEILGDNLRARLADVIGAVEFGEFDARRTGEAFRRLLASRAKR